MNSREKGKRGERAWRDELRAQGFDARRGQQFSGSPESPDVICPALPWIHFEVKCVERLNIEDAMAQARRDAEQKHRTANIEHRTLSTKDDSRERRESLQTATTGGTPVPPKVPVVAHKRNFCGWLVTMDAEIFFKFLRGDLAAGHNTAFEDKRPTTIDGAHGVTRPTEKDLGVSREAHDTTADAAVVPEKTETNINQSALSRDAATKTNENQK